eukprot:CAMPEP_0115064504 /NCGR_PEP_ID=MMETSP0227-20121206/9722_1 /TAXON_ID=89957 /ORGANISM="Polarella glacialis, Strain CCMP 1383" /LENGTH=100 /DNA_ID=CAMNT_0002450169 /DNA_START=241 /DNA_END=543 /DNA_ORIENTATION=-
MIPEIICVISSFVLLPTSPSQRIPEASQDFRAAWSLARVVKPMQMLPSLITGKSWTFVCSSASFTVRMEASGGRRASGGSSSRRSSATMRSMSRGGSGPR